MCSASFWKPIASTQSTLEHGSGGDCRSDRRDRHRGGHVSQESYALTQRHWEFLTQCSRLQRATQILHSSYPTIAQESEMKKRRIIPSPPDPVVRWAAVISASAGVLAILLRVA